MDALYNNQREKLYKLSLERWKILSNENSYLKVMHFHKPDGSSFLRMHKPTQFGDNISSFRPMVKQIHKEQKPIFGFEVGIFNLAYRTFVPIFKENKYIGALEFGTKAEQILHEMKYFNDIDGALFVKKDKLNLHTAHDNIIIDDHTLQYTTIKNNKLLKQLEKKNYKLDKDIKLTIDDSTYSVFSFALKDFNGKDSAKAIFFHDITPIKDEFKDTIKQLTIILIGLLILLIIVINIGFSKIIEALNISHKELEKSHNTINEYIKLIDKNVITSSTNLKGDITYVSDAFAKISGYNKDELIGKTHKIIRHPDMPKSLYVDLWKTITSNNVWQGEIKNMKKDGGYYWVDATISPIYDKKHKKIGYTAIRQDITDKKNIELISITDGLTDIFNRRHFNDIFSKIIQTGKRKNDIICFSIMDVDHFKQYNDTYGHQMGDDVLKAIGSTLKDMTNRVDDYCFRLGGEEFGVVFKAENFENAINFTNQIRVAIENLHIEHKHNSASAYVTASFGLICLYANDIKNDDTMYKMADDMLYAAKETGRNKVMSNQD
ncbi:MAG: diguanylate cyclase [Campylobacterota bacterium]|nr:diguanylate cyclase [Campylobacterota bacterium]